MSLPVNAAVYVRISLDPLDTQQGVARQREDCLALAERVAWQVGRVYEDNSVSAFKRETERPAWLAMLNDLATGVRDGLIVYDLDRLARQPRDLEALIELVEISKLPMRVVTGDIDLSTDGGKLMARVLVSFANKASADTARRVARAAQQRAEEGKPPSSGKWRCYGYTQDWQIVPDEAENIRHWISRILAGESLTVLAQELNSQ